MWQTIPLLTYLENSLIVCSVASVASVVVALLAAYAISRYRFHGRQLFSLTILSTQMFPGILFLLPLFVIFVNLSQTTGINLYGSRTGLIITYMTFTLPFAIWMLAAYLDTIPRELDEAATVDGTGPLGAFIRVVIPAAIPGIVAVGIYAFMTAWSEMLFASVLTNDSTRTLAVGTAGLRHREPGLLEPDHGRVAHRQRADRGRLPAAPAVPGGGHDSRLGQVTVPAVNP